MSARDEVARIWFASEIGGSIADGGEYERECAYRFADQFIADMDKAGYAVVPKEPTAEMIAALRVSAPLGVQIAYKEMLKAAKETP